MSMHQWRLQKFLIGAARLHTKNQKLELDFRNSVLLLCTGWLKLCQRIQEFFFAGNKSTQV